MRILLVILVLSVTAGCTSVYQPRYGDDGIYGPDRYAYSSYPVRVHGYSALYPYWSLDHFYFSRYYSPFSVVVHPFDPWYYPYSAWYWGYPYSHGAFFAYNYPYYGWGPWHRTHPHWRYRPISEPRDYRGRRLASDPGGSWPAAGHRDHRLDRLQQQRLRRGGDGMIIRDHRPASQPASRSTIPSRRAPPSSQQSSRQSSRPAPRQSSPPPSRRSSRAPERVRTSPP